MSNPNTVNSSISLLESITKLREELYRAQRVSENEQMKLIVDEAEIELQVVMTKDVTAGGAVTLWVFNGESAETLANATTQKIKLKLKPSMSSDSQDPTGVVLSPVSNSSELPSQLISLEWETPVEWWHSNINIRLSNEFEQGSFLEFEGIDSRLYVSAFLLPPNREFSSIMENAKHCLIPAIQPIPIAGSTGLSSIDGQSIVVFFRYPGRDDLANSIAKVRIHD